MPVRLLHSSVLIWPKADEVREALRQWAERAKDEHPELRGVGYFGSYARGDWGVGSDLDIVLVLESSRLPRQERGVLWLSLIHISEPTET